MDALEEGVVVRGADGPGFFVWVVFEDFLAVCGGVAVDTASE